ncbi:cation acetate symporter [Nostocoides vanveenii]|uniref:Cation acetate symporter n=1 Tax=Nostocoides vanveenii TaxID=330835 RepID=A0ABN2KN63_9MICO
MHPASLVAIVLVCLATLSVGSLGLRMSRATSDFYVAGRAVTPWRNASAIGGEYLSAASFLGVAGLVYDRGPSMLWFPIGYTVGYLVLLVLVAAPLRRSGAYTLSDFAELRLESPRIRSASSLLTIAIGILYLVPQFQAAGLALRQATGWPAWAGSVVLAVVVYAGVATGGMRSITLIQAMQYWIKLCAIAIPAFVLLAIWHRESASTPLAFPAFEAPGATTSQGLYSTYSTLLALSLGTMGLPHVLVRFYTNPDGRDARRTTVSVLGLLGIFYLFPPVYAILGQSYAPTLPAGMRVDSLVLRLPQLVADDTLATVLGAMLAGGAFAAFLSTASGLVISISGVLDQDVLRPYLRRLTGDDAFGVTGFRIAAIAAVVVPLVIAPLLRPVGLATMVGLAFAVAASTFAPLLVLGVWWPRLTTAGAAAGLAVGVTAAVAAITTAFRAGDTAGWIGLLLTQPAAWSAPLAFTTMVVVSRLTPERTPAHTTRTLGRLHTPEALLPP